MRIKISKLFPFQGRLYASVRDYKIKRCVEKREPLTIIFEGDKMTLKPHQVAFFEQFTPDLFESRTGGENYHLWDYFWEPEKRDEIEELAKGGVFG